MGKLALSAQIAVAALTCEPAFFAPLCTATGKCGIKANDVCCSAQEEGTAEDVPGRLPGRPMYAPRSHTRKGARD